MDLGNAIFGPKFQELNGAAHRIVGCNNLPKSQRGMWSNLDTSMVADRLR